MGVSGRLRYAPPNDFREDWNDRVWVDEVRARFWARLIQEKGNATTLRTPLETSEEIRRRKRQERETVHAIEG